MSTEAIKTWRSDLKQERGRLEQAFLKNTNPASLLKKHSKLIDELLETVWKDSHLDDKISLIAVGGYGRQELFPYSDIDFLILVPENVSETQNKAIETLIGVLWDLGLNVGHSVRSLQECVDEAASDATIQTNLLEARLICGEKALYAQFSTAIKQQLDAPKFLQDKIAEQDKRHAKFNDIGYNLEPNIKENPGGLRDLHSVLWLAQSQGLGHTWLELAKNGVINETELKAVKQHERNLNTLRIRLHYLAKRREDRLLFDFQNELAANLGLANTPRKRASEQLMQNCYRSIRYIRLINEILIKLLVKRSAPNAEKKAITSDFFAQNNLLEPVDANLFQRKNSAILECFLLLQTHPELEGFSPTLLRQLQVANKLITKEFRQSSTNQQLFLEILKQENGVHHSLRRMNRYGVLGKYIPAFGRIVGQMQHDLFHVYTVDAHTINVLANLRRFSKPELEDEFPLCSKLFASFKKPHLLYLAAIFHDIAKGRGGDHSELGLVDAKRFCKLHQLVKKDGELVAWLVGMHLQMSKVAQKSDLSDPKVIEQFANAMGSEKRLSALYLLTVADIRGTSPTVWNAWKAQLLESLFYQTRRALNDASFDVKNVIAERQQDATEKLKKHGVNPEEYREFWNNVGEAYFSRYNSNEITWHSRLLIPHVHTTSPVVRAHVSPEGDGIEVMIYTRNQTDLFARICNFFDRLGYSIGQAKIHTTNHDYALNTLFVLDQSVDDVSYSDLLKHIEDSLQEKISTSGPIEEPIKGRVNRQVKHMPIKTQTTFEESPENKYQRLEINANDQPGLLASIAFIFMEHGVEVHNAKVSTLGNRVEDTFLISDKDDSPLSNEKMVALQAALGEL